MPYVFASREWMACMHGLILERFRVLLQEAPDVSWSICEVFTDPPEDLSSGGRPLAWSCVVRNGEVDFTPLARDDVDFKVEVDYAAVLPLGRFDTMGSPERRAQLQAMSQALTASGRMRVSGDRSRRDPRIGDFHDIIARLTA